MENKFQTLLNEYGQSHQNETNKIIHWVCVPLIFWSILALIYSIPNTWLKEVFGNNIFTNWAVIISFLVIIYYMTLSLPITIGMCIYIFICLLISYLIDAHFVFPLWAIAIIVFVIAWIGQFYGHNVEGKKPSFLKDLQFLLIGPAWLMHFIFKRIGLKY